MCQCRFAKTLRMGAQRPHVPRSANRLEKALLQPAVRFAVAQRRQTTFCNSYDTPCRAALLASTASAHWGSISYTLDTRKAAALESDPSIDF